MFLLMFVEVTAAAADAVVVAVVDVAFAMVGSLAFAFNTALSGDFVIKGGCSATLRLPMDSLVCCAEVPAVFAGVKALLPLDTLLSVNKLIPEEMLLSVDKLVPEERPLLAED